MSIFDSPIARCEAVREMVLTDETQAQCAREHECPADRVCPLCGYFVEPGDSAEKATAAQTLNEEGIPQIPHLLLPA